MAANGDARVLAETLLATTLSAASAVETGDWSTAGNLLRRREQLLTQLENSPNVAQAEGQLRKVQQAEKDLLEKMESVTQEAFADILEARNVRTAHQAYRPSRSGPRIVERYG